MRIITLLLAVVITAAGLAAAKAPSTAPATPEHFHIRLQRMRAPATAPTTPPLDRTQAARLIPEKIPDNAEVILSAETAASVSSPFACDVSMNGAEIKLEGQLKPECEGNHVFVTLKYNERDKDGTRGITSTIMVQPDQPMIMSRFNRSDEFVELVVVTLTRS